MRSRAQSAEEKQGEQRRPGELPPVGDRRQPPGRAHRHEPGHERRQDDGALPVDHASEAPLDEHLTDDHEDRDPDGDSETRHDQDRRHRRVDRVRRLRERVVRDAGGDAHELGQRDERDGSHCHQSDQPQVVPSWQRQPDVDAADAGVEGSQQRDAADEEPARHQPADYRSIERRGPEHDRERGPAEASPQEHTD